MVMRTLSLVVAALVAGRTAPAQQIAVGQTVRAALTGSSGREDGAPGNSHLFAGQAGQQVTITMRAEGFPPVLVLFDPYGSEMARSDGDFMATAAQLALVLPATGTYRILATEYHSNVYAGYTLALAGSGGGGAASAPRAAPPQVASPSAGGKPGAGAPASGPRFEGPVTIGTQVTGDLTVRPNMDTGRPVHLWTLQCAPGQAVQLDVRSAWDNGVFLIAPSGATAGSDDDSGGNLNAQLVHRCQVAGLYVIGVTVAVPGTPGGQYTLQVTRR
jgi:hypothetical protein